MRYASYLGDQEKDPILIDLSLDCSTTLQPEYLSPANRIEVEGLKTYDYLLYPLSDQLADKLCAIMEVQPNGWVSSRMKDLVDIVTYVTHEEFCLRQLSTAIQSECAKRKMPVPKTFGAPLLWQTKFASFAKRSSVPAEYISFESAAQLASSFFNPALTTSCIEDARWDCKTLTWVSL